ncbi:hypothetical protein JOC75_000685 [Metabacillus crassostreae]|uniref:hypothetical protein n=1 Tax=Metabacillus crassostreae TaxID=929098 RepID=UPI00195EA601|nr:hypothetical protein [Metabacillus crassostreae]MBM7602715.1 hypothetical protein [Metabacillus crassostreae]
MKSIRKIDFFFEIKSMGLSAILPLLALLFLVFFNYSELGPEIARKLSIFIEFVICPLAAWWCMYLFIDYYEDNMGEVLFTYPVSIFFHGVLRALMFLLCFLALFIICLFLISQRHEEILFSIQVLQYIPQSILYGALGFCLIVLTRNIVIPILCIVGYVAGKYFTGGSKLMPVYNIMFFDIESSYQLLLEKALINIVFAFLLFVLSHFILARRTLI